MGNDGGSIPDRRDLVRNKPKAEQADKANQTRARWLFCALSKLKLEEPVVSCALGKLYNKDSIIEFLLDRAAFGDGETICGHIRSLKDVKTLKLTPNHTARPSEDNDVPQFICPLTLKEMNGVQPFVYLSTCGCTFSQAGLKTVAKATVNGHEQLELCPQCGKKYSGANDVVLINPSQDEEDSMRLEMERRRLLEPTKKGKKRKHSPTEDHEPAAKKHEVRPSTNPSIAAASRAVMSGLAMEAAKRNAGMSDAVKSLYGSADGKKRKETFMTMNTFTRYA